MARPISEDDNQEIDVPETPAAKLCNCTEEAVTLKVKQN